ncbi:MAG TPA: hypothetical protein VLK82_05900 [Candidatus Tectomicrobia bacterium]|nr:hypothetical protein [Candidatus Tectomicrobia bacterium]
MRRPELHLVADSGGAGEAGREPPAQGQEERRKGQCPAGGATAGAVHHGLASLWVTVCGRALH